MPAVVTLQKIGPLRIVVRKNTEQEERALKAVVDAVKSVARTAQK